MEIKNLGPLEKRVMDCVWSSKEVTVREVHSCLKKHKEIAYTTVMTIMTRLTEKGFLTRKMQGKSFLYSPAASKKKVTKNIVKNIFDGLVNQFGEEAIIAFSDEVDKASKKIK